MSSFAVATMWRGPREGYWRRVPWPRSANSEGDGRTEQTLDIQAHSNP
jgi:hypothetical protein